MRIVGFTKRRMYRYVLGRRDQAQARLDATPGHNQLAMSRALGRREAFDDILSALAEGHVEKAENRGYVAGMLAAPSADSGNASKGGA